MNMERRNQQSDFGRQALKLDTITGRYDPVLAVLAILIAGLGVVMVSSSSIAISVGQGSGPFYFLTRHLIFLAIGLVIGAALLRTELKWLEKRGHLLLVLCFLGLLVVFVPGIGRTVNGARRWVNLGLANFQAVEAVKFMLIVWLAGYLVRNRDAIAHRWMPILKPLGVAGALVALLLLQPDFGSAMLLCTITVGMLVLAGANLPRLMAPAIAALPGVAYLAMSESYRMRRLTTFLNPWADPFKDGFQLTQALIAVGRGEWFGVGLGGSVQKLFYLPEAHTDFILAVIAEELGFVGIAAVVLLYVAFASRCLQLGLRATALRRHFAANCAFGVALWISLQALVSVGVNLGLLPTKGLTLPLISSGGSSVLMSCAAVGLMLRVSYEIDRAQRQSTRLREEFQQSHLAEPALATAPTARSGARARIEPHFGEYA
ncbi:MAG: putative lipid II flippase FtsW [Lysobacteraceae bacterium]